MSLCISSPVEVCRFVCRSVRLGRAHLLTSTQQSWMMRRDPGRTEAGKMAFRSGGGTYHDEVVLGEGVA